MQQVFLVPSGEKHSLNAALDLALARENKTEPFWIRLKEDDTDALDLFRWKSKNCTTCGKPSLCYHIEFEIDKGVEKTSIICSRCDDNMDLQMSLKGSGLMNDPMRNKEATYEWPKEEV